MASLIFCGTNHNTTHTIVNGELVVHDGVLIGFDEDELAAKANEISRGMLDKAARKEVV